MTTARTIIRKAMVEIGALTKTEQPAADEANDGLDALNALLGSWSNYGDNVVSRVQETFTLNSASSYSIGAGQTLNTVRPLQIVEAYITTGGIDYPLVIINQETYNTIGLKNIQGIPEYLMYDNGYPYGTIKLYPLSVSGYTLTLLSEKPITQIATLDTEISFPDGWERALIKNLAIELAPQYSQDVTPALAKSAGESLGAIRLATIRSRPINAFAESRAQGNIYNGWYS